ncbi:helix-turn-helix domain-containing protein [Flavihumibacter fluvii]|uniref:helix-turn-helix domain-containing protein n=1 Tax=Flavihumibacter fluvii TaxID=2838157 RepID=UPI001BDF16E0|nr:helix-turn-helix transcriptional regulator [Flavihumibacter fluvii]
MDQYRDNNLLQNIALVLKQLRDEKGLTQDEVFDATKIHIGRIETAKANPTISTISKLCKFFKIKLADFFQRVDKI